LADFSGAAGNKSASAGNGWQHGRTGSAMPKKTLSDRTLKSLKPAAKGKTYDVPDAIVAGFAVRVSETGRRTFVLTARFPGNPVNPKTGLRNPTRRALGEYGALTLEKARSKARDWLELIRRGIDPAIHEERQRQAELRQQANTFAAVAEDFIKDKLPSERKGREAERDIRREFMPVWGKRPIAEIAPHDVRAIVKAAKDRGAPYQAHNLLVLARRLFSWAIDQHVYGLETSPCDRLKPKAIIGKKVFRTRILNDLELRAFWRATQQLGYPYGPLFQMLALTGQRKSEVAESAWSEFDLARKLWVIPAERMKADAAHIVPLTDDVMAILASLPRFKKGDHLFSTDFGVKSVNGFTKGKVRLDKAMAAELGRAVTPFVIHDLRRTTRTGLSALAVPDLVRELVIAHTKPGLHKVYDQHAYINEKRHALELWAARLRDIVEPPPANVVKLASP
jgi:integrase